MKQITISVKSIDNGFITSLSSYSTDYDDDDYYSGETKELYAPDKAAVEKIIAENLSI